MKALTFKKKVLLSCLIILILLVAYIIYHIDWKECQPLRLSISPVHYKYGFRASSVRPYTRGCVDSILGMTIESHTHERLDDYILNVAPMRYDPLDALYLFTDSIHKDMSTHRTLQIVKKRIQNNCPLDILISMDSLAPPPQYVIIKLQGREIRRKVKTSS